ncbi:alkyl sulfatase dimerization domain-containing protein [Psychromonas aquimarina]|uniref:alkyl sulfatase dimerization domain-containing protein n=1 Tax=Psychromonas aquimarina TaxID=444919 RepID=UPI0003F55C45|nr:alkyl sulfatase dimerization domain-containing protein [Psychromonas aquimarina]
MKKSIIAAAVLLSPFILSAHVLPDLETKVYHDVEFSKGDNPYKVKRYVPEYFKNHSRHFEENFFQHPSAPIWTIIPDNAFATIHVIDAPEGLIIVDTGLNEPSMRPVVEKIKKLSDKPIKAVIYTHPHADHTGGVGAFITQEQVNSGEVEVIADAKFVEAFISENAATGPVMAQRAVAMYGALLQPEDREDYTIGCCGHMTQGATSFIAPTYTIEEQETRKVAGLELTFVHSGGENSAHMVIYAPEYNTVFTGDELQGPAAPQLHSPRGTKFRDTNAWVAAIDNIRGLDPEHLLPGHGRPEYGRDKVEKILTVYRDSMQYQHDQAIRLINQGKGPDQLANEIKIPDYLTLDPFTVETYGNVATNVRSFYSGYISWFDGNPANLEPLPEVESANKLITAMGGRNQVVKLAEKALQDGEIKWSVELSDKLVRVDNNDQQARHLKAAGLRHLGYASINSSNRGFYLTAADELDGLLDMNMVKNIAQSMVANPKMISGMSTSSLMDSLRYKVRPEVIGGTETVYQFNFSDSGETFTVHLRNGIVEVIQGKSESDVTVLTARAEFDKLFYQDNTMLNDLGKVIGKKGDIQRFDNAFDFTFFPYSYGLK